MTLQFLLCFLLDHSLSGKPAAISWGHSSSPQDGPTWKELGLLAAAMQQVICEADPPVMGKLQMAKACSCRQHLNYDFMRDPEPEPPSDAIPDLQKLCEIQNSHCRAKSLYLGYFVT